MVSWYLFSSTKLTLKFSRLFSGKGFLLLLLVPRRYVLLSVAFLRRFSGKVNQIGGKNLSTL